MAAVGRGQKYHAVPTAGYASKGEATRAQELKLLHAAGAITALQEQVWVELLPGIRMRPDFYYVDTATGEAWYEDWKGKPTKDWLLRCRLWKLVGPGRLRITSRHGVREIHSEYRTLSGPA